MLDVDLRIGRELRGFTARGPASFLLGLRDGDAGEVGSGVGVVKRQRSHKHGAAHHGRRKARALLVEPIDDRQVIARLGTRLRHAPGGMSCCQHAISTVETAGQGLRIQVRAQAHVLGAGGELKKTVLVPNLVVDDPCSQGFQDRVEPGAVEVIAGTRRLAFHAAPRSGAVGGHGLEI